MQAIQLRPFGQPADLDLDFGQADRPALVTTLLAGCSAALDAAWWWGQPVGVRTAALLRLAVADAGAGEIGFSAQCAAAECGEAFEFSLPLAALAGQAGQTLIPVALGPGRGLVLRRPTGADLRTWRTRAPDAPQETVRAMLADLIVDGAAGPDDTDAVSRALAEADPLVAFEVDAECPACGAQNQVPIDLEDYALARLLRRRRALLREVHELASHYGWSERQILALTPARRAEYLALVAEAR
ncbi:MAG: hypothetical protein AB1584_09330 [Pseudomonadota bacterium]